MLRSRLVLATFLVVWCASCGANADGPPPSATTSDTTSSPTSPTAPTSSVPPELVGYTEDQRLAYKEALAAYAAFTASNDKIFARGKTTAGARNFYQHYAIDWSTAWASLAEIANNGVTVKGTTRTVWTRPKTIVLRSGRGAVVVMRRCLDESGRIVTQNGERLDQPQLKTPHLYVVRIEKRPGEKWWRSGVAQQGKTC